MEDNFLFEIDESAAAGPLLGALTEILRGADENPRGLAVTVLADLLDVTESALRLKRDSDPVPAKTARTALLNARRLAAGEPLGYVLQKAWFFGRSFAAGPGVLIPRPDTEILLEEALKEARLQPEEVRQNFRVLELCTGSGILAISFLLEMNERFPEANCSAVATDLSAEALSYAVRNREQYKLESKLTLAKADLFPVPAPASADERFSMLLSNPPYISQPEWVNLDPSVKQFEPDLALIGGQDGLDFYRRIAAAAPLYLKAGAPLILEHGWEQGEAVRKIFKTAGHYDDIRTVQDYGQRDRLMACRLKN